MYEFKTPVLEKFYYLILEQYPKLRLFKRKLRKMLQNIELPENASEGEHFYHELDLWDCGPLPIIWNIEKLLKKPPKHPNIKYCTTQELLSLINFDSYLTKDVLAKLLPKGSIEHRGKYIILANLPGFPQFAIIDGNHRVLEEKHNLSCLFECLIIDGTHVLKFLEPNSRKFFKTICFINKIVNGA